MSELSYGRYLAVSSLALVRSWLQMQADLQLAPKTLDAQGGSLEDCTAFCSRCGVESEGPPTGAQVRHGPREAPRSGVPAVGAEPPLS